MLRFMTPGSGAIQPGHLGPHLAWIDHLDESDYFVETWRCDLASGVFHLGQRTAALLGASTRSCGIAGSSGTISPPAFNTASIATT